MTSSPSSESSIAHQAFAASRAKFLLGCYRRDNANDPDSYVLACSLVLARYDEALIREVTDPRTGIQTTEKFRAFAPNAGELKHYCDEQAAVKARIREYREWPVTNAPRLAAPPKQPGRCANLFVGEGMPRYAEMVERTKKGDPAQWRFDGDRRGVWVSLAWWEGKRPEGIGSVAGDVVGSLRAEAAE
jgi:hypothetical protein